MQSDDLILFIQHNAELHGEFERVRPGTALHSFCGIMGEMFDRIQSLERRIRELEADKPITVTPAGRVELKCLPEGETE